MKKATGSNGKPKAKQTTKRKTKAAAPRHKGNGFVIRFRDKKAHLRAIGVLGEVPVPYSGFPDPDGITPYVIGVVRLHLERLDKEKIPYEIL